MRLTLATLLTAATLVTAAPSLSTPAKTPQGPCDLSSEDTGCYLIMDNSGCFLNLNDTSRVLGCADPDPAKAIDIFCRCYGCNGPELVSFMPRLNCSSKTVIPVVTNSTATTPATNSTKSTNGTKSAHDKGTAWKSGLLHIPVPVPHN
ncbi:hypothetical protein SBRCBS47491_000778 [Sporothrix bragantina]|uniref:Uncharacterized protein n=1 Tax=Sporothrix bragantina TaxID=671064 RepID=A0ABP0AT43_9PEZI